MQSFNSSAALIDLTYAFQSKHHHTKESKREAWQENPDPVALYALVHPLFFVFHRGEPVPEPTDRVVVVAELKKQGRLVPGGALVVPHGSPR